MAESAIQKIHSELTGRLEGMTLAVAESVTSGLLQDGLTRLSGSSQFFQGGVTAYNLGQKAHILKVNRDHAKACNCVSAETAQEMANGIRLLFGTEVAVATTGYAEAPEGSPTAYAWICVRTPSRSITFKVEADPEEPRNRARVRFAQAALSELADSLVKEEGF